MYADEFCQHPYDHRETENRADPKQAPVPGCPPSLLRLALIILALVADEFARAVPDVLHGPEYPAYIAHAGIV